MAGETIGFEVHHIFPDAVLKNIQKQIDDVMGDSRINKDDYSNRINLFNNQEMADVMKSFYATQVDKMTVAEGFGSAKHKGSENHHPAYSKFIEDSIKEILGRKADNDVKKYMILDLHRQVSHALKVGEIGFFGEDWKSPDSYVSHFADKLLRIDNLAVLGKDKDGNDFYQFNKNAEAINGLNNYSNTYNRTSMVSNETVVREDFNKAIANIDLNSKVYDVPYSQITINSIKEALAENDTNIMRRALGQMVYDEADKANLIVTKTAIKQFQEMADDDPNKEFLADKIVKNPNVPQEIKNEAVKHLQNVSILQDTIVKSGFGSGFDGLAEIQNIKDINLEFAKRLIKEANFAQRFNIAANVTDFLNHVYDSFIEGWKTGNWDKFRDDIAEYGQEMVLSIVVGYVVIAGLTAMAAAGVVGAEAALIAAAVAGVAATLYGVYELYQKVRDTDFGELIDITKQNFKELFEDNKDWFNEQTNDVIEGFADILTQFDKWGEKNSLTELLKDYKEVLDIKGNNKEAFKHLKQQYDENTKFMGTENNDTLTNTTTEGDHILYGGKGDDILNGNDKMDILIGGEGDDVLDGKEGNDILGGNEGNDTLDGGIGNDILIGGDGNDEYKFSGNYGHDTIDDKDGQGNIKIDGMTLTATERLQENTWQSSHADHIIQVFKTKHNTEGHYNLRITSKNDKNKSIKIPNWKQGDLGLTLEGLGEQTSPPLTDGFIYGNDLHNIIYDQQYVSSLAGDDLVQSTINDDIIDDIIDAGEGNDAISTGNGDDIIFAGDGHDVIYGGTGKDRIYGGAGDDVILSSATVDLKQGLHVNDSAGNRITHQPYDGDTAHEYIDIPQTHEHTNEHQQGYFNRFITTHNHTSPAPTAYMAGHHLLPILWNKYVNKAGEEMAWYALRDDLDRMNKGQGHEGADTVYGGEGHDLIIGSSDADSLYGQEDNDKLYGLNGHDILDGGEGNDELYGGDGLDVLMGGTGNDKLIGGLDGDQLYGGEGDDVLHGDLPKESDRNTISTSSLFEQFGNDYLDGGDGDDRLIGSGGNDTLVGGLGNDRLYGDDTSLDGQYHGDDRLDGGAGNDWLVGQGGDDALSGGEGDDELQGDDINLDGQHHGDDILHGGVGHDRLFGQGGNDTLHGGDGNDELQGDYIDLDGRYHGDDTLDGGAGNDLMAGQGGNDTLSGGTGDDKLHGDDINLDGQYHGNDTLDGGEGNDMLWGFGGQDTLHGGEGDDHLEGDYKDLDAQYHGNDILDGGKGDDWLAGQGGDDTLYGGEGDDELQGDYKDLDAQYHGNDTLYGGAGNDKLFGQGGNDTLYGGEGDDILSDGTGDDWVYGDAGNDYFYVGSGEDHLHGGEGNDYYLFKQDKLQDGKTKYVVDSDGRGQILIDGRNIFASDWRVSLVENKNGTIHMKWKDSQKNYLEYVDNKLIMSSDHFTAQIVIEGFDIQTKDGQNQLINTNNTTAKPIVLPMDFLPNVDSTSPTQTQPSKPNNDGLLNLLNQQSNPLITFTSNGNNAPFSAYLGAGIQTLSPQQLLLLLSQNQHPNHGSNNRSSNPPRPINTHEPLANLPLGQSIGITPWGSVLPNLLPNLTRNQAGEFTHQYQIQRYDPLVLDLNQDGHIGTIAENKHRGVMFDQDADGIATATAWLSPEDGFLVRDLNQDGLINHGKELFGDQTQLKNGMKAQHGFEALADLDSNQDGIINADDDAFLELKVWRDLNLNGQTEQGELFSLSEVGISDIDVQIKTTQEVTTTGGILREQGTYTTLTGEKRLIADIHFNQNVIYSQHKNTLNTTHQGLNIKGYGRLDELADAKSTHAELATLIEGFEKNKSFDFIFNHSSQLMKLWSMTDQQYSNHDIDVINTHNIRWQESDDATHTVRLRPSETVPNNMRAEHYQTHTQKLSAENKAQVKFVDAITGIQPTTYVNQATTNQLQQFKTLYQRFKAGIEGELINQTILKPYFNAIKHYQIANLHYSSFDKMTDLFINQYQQNGSKTSLELLNLLGINASYFSQHDSAKPYQLMSQWYSQHKSSIDEYLKNHQTVVNTKFIDDTISDYALTMTDRTVYLTGTGAKKVIGSERDETFISGQHDDVLMGKGGNNTYILSNLSGSDTIEFDYDSHGLDRFLFDDVDVKDVRFMSQGKNLVLQFGDNTVILTNVLHTGAKRQFELVFNQEHYYLADLKQMDMAVVAMDDGLYFSGWEHDDTLIGNEQDNVMYGFEGADILEGQAGQDRLYGGTGYDTYRFDANAGHDEVYEDWLSKEGNHLQFNLAQNQLQQLYYQQDDLIFIYGDHNKLVLKNVAQADLHLLDISFIDRPKQSLNALLSERAYILGADNTDVITHHYAVSNNNIYAQSGDDEVQGKENVRNMLDGGAGDDTLTGGALEDTLIGGMGHDTLFGRAGDDTLQGDDGNDWLEGGAGADTLIGGLGDDTYMADSSDRIIEQADGGYDRLHISASYDLQGTNIEELILLGNDNLTAYGSEHNDTLIGNTGNNHLDGRAGIDTLIGGLGDDYYVLDDGQDVIVERWGEGIDTLEQWTDRHFSYHVDEQGRLVGSDSYAMLPHHVENLILKGHAKTAFGNDLDNTITLNTQNNFVNALSGNDTIIYQKGGGKDTIASTDSINSKDTLVIEGYDLSEASFMRVRNTASAHDMLQIHFKGNANDVITLFDYFAPTTQVESFGDIINQDNRIDEIVFNKHGQTTTLTQAEFEARIISQANNRAPQVNKHPKTIHAQAGKALQVQFDQDTIKDPDAYDDKLDYSITLTTKNGDGQYNTIPSWLHFDANTLTLTGTPPQTEVGHLTFILWGKDTFNHSAGTYVTLNITQANTGTTNSTAVTPTPTTIPYLVASNPKATNNTYLYTGGQYILKDTGGQDILRFASNIKANQVTRHLIKQGDDLILKVNNQDSNTLTITNYFNAQGRIEQMRFGDGVTVGHQQIYNAFGVRSTMLSSRSADNYHFSTAQAVDTLIQAMSTTASPLGNQSASDSFNTINWSDNITRNSGLWGAIN